MKMKHLLIIILFLSTLTTSWLMGDDFTPKTGKKKDGQDNIMIVPVPVSMENLDEISVKQLGYFMEIAESVDVLNRIDFFKPYNRTLKGRISVLLNQAAEIEPDQCHKQYLTVLSTEVLDDRFYSIVPEWFNLEENKTEIIFMPDERHVQKELFIKLLFPLDRESFNFENADPDERLNLFNADGENKIFDTFVYLNDFDETLKVEQYIKGFDKMLDNLPSHKGSKIPYTPLAPQIKIARLVYSSMPQWISLVYPHRELFYTQGRFKVVIFKNIADAYVECVLKHIAERILLDNRTMGVDPESYLSNLVMHKISHHMGKVFTVKVQQDKKEKQKTKEEKEKTKGFEIEEKKQEKGKKKERELMLVSETMGNLYPVIEEIKAGAIALHNTSVLIEEGMIPREKEMDIYATYLVSLVDQLRKNPKGFLNRANIVQFNYLLKKGAIVYNVNHQRLFIDSSSLIPAVEELAKTLLVNVSMIFGIIREFGQPGPELEAILKNVEDIPVKTEFQFNK